MDSSTRIRVILTNGPVLMLAENCTYDIVGSMGTASLVFSISHAGDCGLKNIRGLL